jgi:DNA-binding response OmpR family regulator
MHESDHAAPPTILVVDDSHDLVDLLTCLLSRRGMQVLSAYSGQECLRRVRQHPIDVILLDVMMPGMDGLEVCAALREMTSICSIPIILLTARDDIRTRIAGAALGVSDFVVKPIKGKDLLERIQTQVEVSRRIRALEQVLATPSSGNL